MCKVITILPSVGYFIKEKIFVCETFTPLELYVPASKNLYLQIRHAVLFYMSYSCPASQ